MIVQVTVLTYWFPDCIGWCTRYPACWEYESQEPEEAYIELWNIAKDYKIC